MKVYVAAASAEIDRAEDFIQEVRDAGYTITHDWTRTVRAHHRGEYVDEEMAANDDVVGVQNADIVVALLPELLPTKGLWVEIGIAVGANVPVMLVGQPEDADIWRFLCSFEETEADALMGLATKAAGG